MAPTESPTERDSQTYAILGAAFEVHRTLGCGFVEHVYQDALAHEFALQDVPCEREAILRVRYKGEVLGSFYRPDFLCFGEVIVEVKAEQEITAIDLAQMINYLRVSGRARGLLLNFGGKSLQWRRVISTNVNPAEQPDYVSR